MEVLHENSKVATKKLWLHFDNNVMYIAEFLPIMLRIYFKSRTVIDIISPSVSHFLSHHVWHRHGLVMKV